MVVMCSDNLMYLYVMVLMLPVMPTATYCDSYDFSVLVITSISVTCASLTFMKLGYQINYMCQILHKCQK